MKNPKKEIDNWSSNSVCICGAGKGEVHTNCPKVKLFGIAHSCPETIKARPCKGCNIVGVNFKTNKRLYCLVCEKKHFQLNQQKKAYSV